MVLRERAYVRVAYCLLNYLLLCCFVGELEAACKKCTTPGSGRNLFCTSTDDGGCYNCIGGTYFTGSPAATVCTNCVAGKYSSESRATSAATCISCGEGSYSAAGASACTLCPKGTFSGSGTGKTACGDCIAGFYSASTGSKFCTMCLDGQYSAARASTCTTCAAGTRSVLTSCVNCAAGEFSPAGSITCTVCAAGTYSTQAKSGACTACASCPSGQFRLGCGGSSAGYCCNKCSAGSYASGCSSASVGACITCATGTYSLTDSVTTCSSCTASLLTCRSTNTIRVDCGGNSLGKCCRACSAGQYAKDCNDNILVNNAGTCTACPTGSWCPANTAIARSCAQQPLCQEGYERIGCGGTSPGVCTACANGKYRSSTSSICLDCPSGKYAPGTASTSCYTCESCLAGYFRDDCGGYSGGVCALCAAGTYKTISGTHVCTACASGTYKTNRGTGLCTTCSVCSNGQFRAGCGGGSAGSCITAVTSAQSCVQQNVTFVSHYKVNGLSRVLQTATQPLTAVYKDFTTTTPGPYQTGFFDAKAYEILGQGVSATGFSPFSMIDRLYVWDPTSNLRATSKNIFQYEDLSSSYTSPLFTGRSLYWPIDNPSWDVLRNDNSRTVRLACDCGFFLKISKGRFNEARRYRCEQLKVAFDFTNTIPTFVGVPACATGYHNTHVYDPNVASKSTSVCVACPGRTHMSTPWVASLGCTSCECPSGFYYSVCSNMSGVTCAKCSTSLTSSLDKEVSCMGYTADKCDIYSIEYDEDACRTQKTGPSSLQTSLLCAANDTAYDTDHSIDSRQYDKHCQSCESFAQECSKRDKILRRCVSYFSPDGGCIEAESVLPTVRSPTETCEDQGHLFVDHFKTHGFSRVLQTPRQPLTAVYKDDSDKVYRSGFFHALAHEVLGQESHLPAQLGGFTYIPKLYVWDPDEELTPTLSQGVRQFKGSTGFYPDTYEREWFFFKDIAFNDSFYTEKSYNRGVKVACDCGYYLSITGGVFPGNDQSKSKRYSARHFECLELTVTGVNLPANAVWLGKAACANGYYNAWMSHKGGPLGMYCVICGEREYDNTPWIADSKCTKCNCQQGEYYPFCSSVDGVSCVTCSRGFADGRYRDALCTRYTGDRCDVSSKLYDATHCMVQRIGEPVQVSSQTSLIDCASNDTVLYDTFYYKQEDKHCETCDEYGQQCYSQGKVLKRCTYNFDRINDCVTCAVAARLYLDANKPDNTRYFDCQGYQLLVLSCSDIRDPGVYYPDCGIHERDDKSVVIGPGRKSDCNIPSLQIDGKFIVNCGNPPEYSECSTQGTLCNAGEVQILCGIHKDDEIAKRPLDQNIEDAMSTTQPGFCVSCDMVAAQSCPSQSVLVGCGDPDMFTDVTNTAPELVHKENWLGGAGGECVSCLELDYTYCNTDFKELFESDPGLYESTGWYMTNCNDPFALAPLSAPTSTLGSEMECMLCDSSMCEANETLIRCGGAFSGECTSCDIPNFLQGKPIRFIRNTLDIHDNSISCAFKCENLKTGKDCSTNCVSQLCHETTEKTFETQCLPPLQTYCRMCMQHVPENANVSRSSGDNLAIDGSFDRFLLYNEKSNQGTPVNPQMIHDATSQSYVLEHIYEEPALRPRSNADMWVAACSTSDVPTRVDHPLHRHYCSSSYDEAAHQRYVFIRVPVRVPTDPDIMNQVWLELPLREIGYDWELMVGMWTRLGSQGTVEADTTFNTTFTVEIPATSGRYSSSKSVILSENKWTFLRFYLSRASGLPIARLNHGVGSLKITINKATVQLDVALDEVSVSRAMFLDMPLSPSSRFLVQQNTVQNHVAQFDVLDAYGDPVEHTMAHISKYTTGDIIPVYTLGYPTGDLLETYVDPSTHRTYIRLARNRFYQQWSVPWVSLDFKVLVHTSSRLQVLTHDNKRLQYDNVFTASTAWQTVSTQFSASYLVFSHPDQDYGDTISIEILYGNVSITEIAVWEQTGACVWTCGVGYRRQGTDCVQCIDNREQCVPLESTYVSTCSADGYNEQPICAACTNAPTAHSSYVFRDGKTCQWLCDDDFYPANSNNGVICNQCNTALQCDIGFYASKCVSKYTDDAGIVVRLEPDASTDAQCRPCTTLQTKAGSDTVRIAVYNSSGSAYGVDDCEYECPVEYFRSEDNCARCSKIDCKRILDGFKRLEQCTKDNDASCVPCDDPAPGRLMFRTTERECASKCMQGFHPCTRCASVYSTWDSTWDSTWTGAWAATEYTVDIIGNLESMLTGPALDMSNDSSAVMLPDTLTGPWVDTVWMPTPWIDHITHYWFQLWDIWDTPDTLDTLESNEPGSNAARFNPATGAFIWYCDEKPGCRIGFTFRVHWYMRVQLTFRITYEDAVEDAVEDTSLYVMLYVYRHATESTNVDTTDIGTSNLVDMYEIQHTDGSAIETWDSPITLPGHYRFEFRFEFMYMTPSLTLVKGISMKDLGIAATPMTDIEKDSVDSEALAVSLQQCEVCDQSDGEACIDCSVTYVPPDASGITQLVDGAIKCGWVCNDEYVPDNRDNPSKATSCIYCPFEQCEVGQYLQDCGVCVPCSKDTIEQRLQDRVTFTSPGIGRFEDNCEYGCSKGYYSDAGALADPLVGTLITTLITTLVCHKCSEVTCETGQFQVGCQASKDNTCRECSKCGAGLTVASECNATDDTICIPCEDVLQYPLPDGAEWVPASGSTSGSTSTESTSGCAWDCTRDPLGRRGSLLPEIKSVVYNNTTQTCQACENKCPRGSYATNCTERNSFSGCEPCAIPTNATATGPGQLTKLSCPWECVKGHIAIYETSNGTSNETNIDSNTDADIDSNITTSVVCVPIQTIQRPLPCNIECQPGQFRYTENASCSCKACPTQKPNGTLSTWLGYPVTLVPCQWACIPPHIKTYISRDYAICKQPPSADNILGLQQKGGNTGNNVDNNMNQLDTQRRLDSNMPIETKTVALLPMLGPLLCMFAIWFTYRNTRANKSSNYTDKYTGKNKNKKQYRYMTI